jgi:glycosyltransferase involved in cell wall biosynthesis
LVSVIIPAYNAESTLALTLDSVASSDYDNLETLVVCDACTDRTAEIAGRYDARVINNENQSGAAYARNVGCAVAQGPIFFFVDADVILNPDAISLAVDALTASDAEVLFGSYIAETRATGFFSRFKNYQHHYVHQQGREFQTSFWSGCGAIRRDLFEELAGFDVSLMACEDIEFGYAITQTGRPVHLLKSMRGEHLKRYDLIRLIKSDLFHRAIPWTRMIRSGRAEMGRLNTGSVGVRSTLLTALSHLSLPLASLSVHSVWLFVAAIMGIGLLNKDLLSFIAGKAGRGFALRSLAALWLHYSICGYGYLLGHLYSKYPRQRTPAPQYAWTEVEAANSVQLEASH